MRLGILITAFALLISSVVFAADDAVVNLLDDSGSDNVTVAAKKDKKDKDDKGLEFLFDLLGDLMDSVGGNVAGDVDESELNVDGEDNEVTRIDTLTININVGDVVISKSGGEGAPEFGGRFSEFLGRMHGGGGFNGPGHGRQMDGPHPPMEGMGGGMHNPGFMPDDHSGGPMGMGHNMESGPGMMAQMPERMEIFSKIPPEVDPGFIRFIMHVGALAWEHPEFRERLEQMVSRVENAGDKHQRER